MLEFVRGTDPATEPAHFNLSANPQPLPIEMTADARVLFSSEWHTPSGLRAEATSISRCTPSSVSSVTVEKWCSHDHFRRAIVSTNHSPFGLLLSPPHSSAGEHAADDELEQVVDHDRHQDQADVRVPSRRSGRPSARPTPASFDPQNTAAIRSSSEKPSTRHAAEVMTSTAVCEAATPATATTSVSHPDRSTPRAYRVAERGVDEQQHRPAVHLLGNRLFRAAHPPSHGRSSCRAARGSTSQMIRSRITGPSRMPGPPELALAASHSGVSATPSSADRVALNTAAGTFPSPRR